MEGLRYSVLGALDVRGPDGPVVLGGPRQRAVLSLLLLHAGNIVATEILIDGLWGDNPPPTAERTLHAYIARLRGILEPDHRPAGGLIRRVANGYRLSIAHDQLDARAFEDALLAARRELAAGETEAGAARLRHALGMWRGDAFSDLLEFPGIAPAAIRLEHMRADAQVDTVEAELSLGRHEQVVPDLENLLAQRPLDERLWAALATAHYRSGRQGDALETIARARRVLVEQLGIEPGLQLRDLQGAVLAGDPRLDAPSRGWPTGALEHPGLEGRAEPLERFRQAWRRASSGAGGLLIVSGPGGIGRSRLLRALAAEARAADGHVVDLNSIGAAVPGEPAGDAVFLSSTLAAGGDATLLLTVDDLDRGGVVAWRAWAAIAEAAAEQPALLVFAVRDDLIDADLSAILSRIDPTGDRTLRLRPLAPEEVARVASAYVGQDLALEAGLAVSTIAGGNPGRVHREIEAWAKRRLRDVVSRSARSAAGDWSGAKRGQAELIGGVMDLVAVDVAAAAARAVAAPTAACPYPGLAPFEAQSAAFFAGREELVAAATARLIVAGSLVVIGPSGAGKSSLIRAGVVPAIRAGILPGSERWQVDVVTPGNLGELNQANTDDRLIVLDQMEELLGYNDADRARLVATVHSLMRDAARILFVTRSDQYTRLTDDPLVVRLLDAPQLHVGPMSERQLIRAVEVPVQRAGGSCEDGLAAGIARELASEPGALALLSTTMTQLWDRCPGGRLTVRAYNESGGVREAVARLAEETYSRLSGPERVASRILLLRMAASDELGHVVRSFIPLASLPESADAQTALHALVEDRLVVVDDDRATVAHEALFFVWPRLARWVREDDEARIARARLTAAVRAWVESGRQPTDLARGPRLAAASELARQYPETLSENETTFVRASEELAGAHERELVGRAEAERRTSRRLRRMFVVTAALLVIAVVSAAVDLHLRHRAVAAATVATARELGAQAITTGRLDVAMLLAAQAAKLDPGPQSFGDLIAVMSRAPQAARIMVGTGQRILSVAVGGPGPRAVAMDRRGTAVVFDTSTGGRLSLPAGVGNVSAAAFSPDGRNLVLGGGDPLHAGRGHVFFLDARTLRLNGLAIDIASQVDALAYTGDGRRLAVLTDDGSAHMLDVGMSSFTAAPLATGIRHPTAISFDRETRWMLTLGQAEVRPVGSTRPLPLPAGYPGALSPDGSTVAVANGGQIKLVNRANGNVMRVLAGHSGPVEALSFSTDGKLLASVADDGLAIVSDVANGARVAVLSGHAGRVNAVAFSRDGRSLVTGGFDGRLVAWNLPARATLGGQVGSLAGIRGATALADSYAAMSATTGRVLVGEPAGTVVIARTSGQVVASFPGAHHGDVYDAELSRDGRLGATAGGDSTVRMWDVVAGRPYQPVPVLHTAMPPASVAISADHRLVAWGDLSGTLTMASLEDGHVLWRHRLDSAANAASGAIILLAFSPDDRTVAANVLHVATELVAVDGTGSPRLLHAADNNASAIAFSADGVHLVTGDGDGSAQLWDLRNGTALDLGPSEAAANAAISGAAFDPSGSTFVTWALDGSVQVWDPRSGQAIGPPVVDPQDGAVMAAAWQNAGELTTLRSSGAEIGLPLQEAGLVNRACALAGRELSPQEWAHYLPARPYRPACTH